MISKGEPRLDGAREDSFARLVAFSVVFVAAVLLVSALFIGPASAASSDKLEEVLAGLTKAYEPVDSLQANFVQTSSGMSYTTPMVQKGSVALQRPAKMHWDFREPSRQQYISDGSNYWAVDHGAKTATVYRAMDSMLQHYFGLLTGLQDVQKSFVVSLDSDGHARPGATTLKLIPRSDTSGMGTLFVHVSHESGLVEGVTNVTAFGDTTLLELVEITLNKTLAPTHFRWDKEEGFRLIEGG